MIQFNFLHLLTVRTRGKRGHHMYFAESDINFFLAARGAEEVFLSLVLARELCRLFANGHFIDQVRSSSFRLLLSFIFASGIYPLKSYRKKS